MAFFKEPVRKEPLTRHPRRQFISAALGLGLSVCSGGLGFGQGTPSRSRQAVRIPVSATGQDAIERVRGRLSIAFEDLGLTFGAPVFLRIIKEQRRLEVWVQSGRGTFVRLRFYKICGSTPRLGPRRPGRSSAQPEGFYALGAGSLRPQSVAYLGLDMGWPNAFDRAQGWSGPPSLLQAGCATEPHFGLPDQDMEEVYALVHAALSAGQRQVALHVFPFEMGGLRMLTQAEGRDTAFWRGLAPAWQAFERTKKPPQMRVVGRRYVLVQR
jgi:murein L,D-transpeptidase YafK